MSSETSPPDHAASSVVCSHGARRRRSPRSAALLPGALQISRSSIPSATRQPPLPPLLRRWCSPTRAAAHAGCLHRSVGHQSPLNSTLQISYSPPPHLLPSAVPRPEQQLATRKSVSAPTLSRSPFFHTIVPCMHVSCTGVRERCWNIILEH